MSRHSQSTPVPANTIQGYSPRFSKFLSEEPLPPRLFVHDHEITPAEATSNTLRETRHRFFKKSPENHDERKYVALNRRYVLDVYDQAISKLGVIPSKHVQIVAECTRKVRVILGIITADPSDPVFTTSGQLLAPLEPQYANPRIGFREDEEGHRAQWRMEQWKKEGWPDEYPAEAIWREDKVKAERLIGPGRMSEKVLRKRSQQEDGIVDFDEEEDRRRVRKQAEMKRMGKKKVGNGDLREGSVRDTEEWEDMEFCESDDWS